jgi:hypothetical protein
MRWVQHVACVGEMRNTGSRLKNLKGKDYLADIGIDERKI